jgi:hypothetical protein
MVYRGHVENGVVRLEDVPTSRDSAEVEVRLLGEGEEVIPSVCEVLKEFV